MQADRPKQYLELQGKSLLQHVVETMLQNPLVTAVALVVSADDPYIDALFPPENSAPRLMILRNGGATRAETVTQGLQVLHARCSVADDDWILVHDAARPGLSAAALQGLISDLQDDPVGGMLALPVADSVKRAYTQAGRHYVRESVAREDLWLAQTPQMFRAALLLRALRQGLQDAPQLITDEASAIQLAGLPVRLVEGCPRNLKVTRSADLAWLQGQYAGSQAAAAQTKENTMQAKQHAQAPLRIGQGYDSHRLVAGRKLIIGGVEIAHHTGLHGHSDADVLLHAITDALLGAAALGDIGSHFPDTDPAWAGADSRRLLRAVYEKVCALGWRLGNLDATIIAQAPKMAPHIPHMLQHLAQDLQVSLTQLSVKAKTNEKMGFLGREEGIAAQAVVLLYAA
ncbi:2-C-methyl-D-erythritol 2,4-cyclodiphosphate synthase [Massilia sp. W12]|uniref:2-C-methyl-D-erythritol 2,4-cyclodiphosphate synthase n=1 Tax=Massilia sp. W12 TaxID=3126507 RepID=UPI0030D14105